MSIHQINNARLRMQITLMTAINPYNTNAAFVYKKSSRYEHQEAYS